MLHLGDKDATGIMPDRKSLGFVSTYYEACLAMARLCALEPQKIEKGRRSLYKLIDWVTGLVLNP